MIYIAVLIHLLGNLSPKWLLKNSYEKSRINYTWLSSFLKLSGLITSFLFAFILISILTLTGKDRFIENNKTIYGLEFSETLKKIGFVDGCRIISMNDQEIDRVSNIIIRVILKRGNTKVIITKNDTIKELIITDNDKLDIMRSGNSEHVKAITLPDSILGSSYEKVQITETHFGVSKIFETFDSMWKQAVVLISPATKNNKQIGGFVSISEVQNLRGFSFILSFNLLVIGIFNFLPLPGFSIGNFAISIIENKRRVHFNKTLMNVLRFISVSTVIAFILIPLYL